ncbi:MAG: hypothetical protein MZV63_40355 [Marinilabiliales bacterium]|nr:hypothetical protein [Marinilabiliales bacterium]
MYCPVSLTVRAETISHTLLKALGSPHIAAPSYAQCRGPREVAFQATFGEALDSP